MVDVVSCLQYGNNYVVMSSEDAVRLSDAANALGATEVQVAIPPHVRAKDYEMIVKCLAESQLTRMVVVNPRDPSKMRITIIDRVMERIMKPKRIKLTVTSMVEVLHVEEKSGVQYLIAFPNSFPYPQQASIACVAYSRGFLVINGPFATPSLPTRIASFSSQLGKHFPKTDWASLGRTTITWIPLVVLLAGGAYAGYRMLPKIETWSLKATPAVINVNGFSLFSINEVSPKPLQDFAKSMEDSGEFAEDFGEFAEDFLLRYLKKAFSIDASTMDELEDKLLADHEKLSESSELDVIVNPSGGLKVKCRDPQQCRRVFKDFMVAVADRYR